MKRVLFGVALAALSVPLTATLPPVHADDSSITYDNTNFSPSSDDNSSASDASAYAYQGQSGFAMDGLIRRTDADHDRLVLYGDDNRRYNVDDYNAQILLRGTDRMGGTADLTPGTRVHIAGTLLGRSFLEADRIRVLSPRATGDSPEPTALVLPMPEPAPVPTVTIQPVPAPAGHDISFDAQVTRVDADGRRVSLLGPDDRRLTADTRGADIILRTAERAGLTADLARGMHVHLIGTQGPDGLIQADRIRVLPDLPAPDVAPIPAPTAPVPAAITIPADINLDQYTGILIDARDLHAIQRSPAPTIVGPGLAPPLLYPDRAHVPTPDEVQEESIVRYYRTVDSAMDGIAGAHPLVLRAVAVVGSDDGLQLTAEDAALFQALDTKLHFTRTWKVGFLIPADR